MYSHSVHLTTVHNLVHVRIYTVVTVPTGIILGTQAPTFWNNLESHNRRGNVLGGTVYVHDMTPVEAIEILLSMHYINVQKLTLAPMLTCEIAQLDVCPIWG